MKRLALAMVVLTGACKPTPAPKAPPASAPVEIVLPGEGEVYNGPPVDMVPQIVDVGGVPHNDVVVTVQAPNPGWSISADQGERLGGVLRIFVTLTPPPEGVMLTQVITPMSATFREPYQPISNLEVYVKVAGKDGDFRFARRKPDL